MAVKISESALPETAHAPCTACSWSAERQQRSLYNSHVQLFYSMGDRGAWSLGNRIILKERDFAESNNEIVNCRFLSQSTTLPVPEIIEHWNEVGRSFILSRRVPGQTLEAAWPSLSPDDRERIAKQTAAYLKQLRLIQSSRMQCLEGKPIYSALLFRCIFAVVAVDLADGVALRLLVEISNCQHIILAVACEAGARNTKKCSQITDVYHYMVSIS